MTSAEIRGRVKAWPRFSRFASAASIGFCVVKQYPAVATRCQSLQLHRRVCGEPCPPRTPSFPKTVHTTISCLFEGTWPGSLIMPWARVQTSVLSAVYSGHNVFSVRKEWAPDRDLWAVWESDTDWTSETGSETLMIKFGPDGCQLEIHVKYVKHVNASQNRNSEHPHTQIV